MPNFVLIFRQGPHPLTEADQARRQREISAWAREQNAAGHRLEPRILREEARCLDDVVFNAGGAGPGTWPLTALVFIEARDLDEAAGIAAVHPGRRFGVSIEVRPWGPPVLAAAAAL
jgi:hypothetical protein